MQSMENCLTIPLQEYWSAMVAVAKCLQLHHVSQARFVSLHFDLWCSNKILVLFFFLSSIGDGSSLFVIFHILIQHTNAKHVFKPYFLLSAIATLWNKMVLSVKGR